MQLKPAIEADFPEVVDLANLAYRKQGQGASWNTETGIIEGQRLNESMLRDDLAARPDSVLLIVRDDTVRDNIGRKDGPQPELIGTVWLEPKRSEPFTWYLGLLTVRPDLQSRQLGRTILAEAEQYVRERGGRRIRMTVLNVRSALIAWYERRGYARTGETEPFPYDDDRFGTPLRGDLEFLVLAKDL